MRLSASVFKDIQLRVPISMGRATRIQVIVEGRVRGSRTLHSSAQWTLREDTDTSSHELTDIGVVQKRIGTVLPRSFATDYLAKIGVEGIAFPWEVIEHYGNTNEMMVKVDMNPSVQTLIWDEHSWAPLFEEATSVESAIFLDDIKLMIVSGIDRVDIWSSEPPPKMAYIQIDDASDSKSPAAHV